MRAAVRAAARVLGAAILLAAGPALAARPFDSTDASVPAPGEFELELGPVGLLHEGSKGAEQRFIVAPKVVLNLGVIPSWEVVLEGRQLIRTGDTQGEARYQLVDTGAFIKGVLRAGVLQDLSGPSVGVEMGALLPTVNGEDGLGAAAIVVLSHRIAGLTGHLNGVAVYSRSHIGGLAGGLILEGPQAWAVRPVGEMVVEKERGSAVLASVLGGAIWRVNDSLMLDLAGRAGRGGGAEIWEIRAGLTWSTRLWR